MCPWLVIKCPTPFNNLTCRDNYNIIGTTYLRSTYTKDTCVQTHANTLALTSKVGMNSLQVKHHLAVIIAQRGHLAII